MLKMLNAYGNTFAEVWMREPNPLNNVYIAHVQGYASLVQPSQILGTTGSTALMQYSVNHAIPTYLPIRNHQSATSVGSGNLITVQDTPDLYNYQYSCNFLAQLEGNFCADELDGDHFQIVLAAYKDIHYAIVRVFSTGEERFIYDENSRFTLCSVDDGVEAVMLKGTSSLQWLTWWRNDGKPILWRRMTNKLEPVENLTQRYFSDQQPLVEDNRPEITKPDEDATEELTNNASQETLSANSAMDQKLSDDELFNIFRTWCEDPVVFQKVMHWGTSRTPNLEVTDMEIKALCTGRLWVNARLSSKSWENAGKLQGVLDDLQGAYQEVRPGVYSQPAQKINEPGIQHRLRNINGYWVIERHDLERGIWRAYIQELPNGKWLDLTSGKKMYNIHIIQMLNILNRMKDDWSEYDEMVKRFEYLFNSCNQKQLCSKRSSRSLKRHISNLRVRLEKRYALSFALRVANIADYIALKRCKGRETESSQVQ